MDIETSPVDFGVVHWRSPSLRDKWLKSNRDLGVIKDLLMEAGGLDFPAYKSGLTPASVLLARLGNETGMGYAWIRDNCFVADALFANGDHDKALGIARAVLRVFRAHEQKLDDIISGETDANDVMQRPPVRVDGDTLAATGKWPNAQNDSIGYALWIVAKFVGNGALKLSDDDWRIVAKLIDYLDRVVYWQDADNGHWEEDRQVHAASIGVVIAGLEAVKSAASDDYIDRQKVEEMIYKGRIALDNMLRDCPQDAAMLFLVEPLQVVDERQAAVIVDMVETHLLREHGVIRYPDDSYWGPDYRDHFGVGDRTADFSERMDERAQFAAPGQEAQWTLFDPILSAYYARKYSHTHDDLDSQKSLHYLERSLASFVDHDGRWRVPEAYFLEHGQWAPNDHTPLLWSQANLLKRLS